MVKAGGKFFSFEIDLTTAIDKTQEDIILREIQRHTNKHALRYPQLIEQGRAPVVLDVKNCGCFILVEVVLYNGDSKSMIEARRRARIERRQRSGDTFDRDF